MKILLVDDDTSVIQTLLAVLKTLPGHDLRAATGGEKALENAASLGGLDLLITDVVMEPMDGFTLRDQMVARYPGVRTIFISGYDLSDYPEQLGQHQFVAKPIDTAALLEAVSKELAARSAPVAVARAVAAPTVVAQARAVAAAAPTVVAQPRAVAAAAPTAVAQPKVVAASAPTVVAQPKAVAAPTVVAQPKAVAPAQPRAVAVPPSPPRAVAAPRAVAPVAAPSLETAPTVRVVAAPPPTAPRAVPPPPPAPTPLPPSATEAIAWATSEPSAPSAVSSGEGLIGQTVGAYQIVSLLGEGRWGTVYAAVQIAINRPVGLKILDPARSGDDGTKGRFIADARAKAHVQHPSILSVYEAGESAGHIFYAHEYVDGSNLGEMAAAQQKIDEPSAMKIIRSVAEGMAYLHLNNIPHTPLEASSIYLGVDGHPRLSNLATQHADQQLSVEEEITALGRAMFAIIHTGPQLTQGLRMFLARMVQAASSGLNSWGLVLQGIKALEPKIVPVEAAKISAQDRAAIAVVESARKQQKKSLLLTVVSMVTLAALAAWVVWAVLIKNSEHVIDEMVAIPAGNYIVGERRVTLEQFWIDKHEVTIGQYARFVAYLDANPGSSHDFDHPRQPKHLGHEPPHWAIFYGRAKLGKPVHSAPYSLDAPMVEVTWWDAYAYAKWRGRELPTEDQWEAAARGADGHTYPWGDEFDKKKVNSNADFNGNDPGTKGKVDGWNFWSPVDAISGDKSPFGVIGMAGNVSEWVNTWTPDNRFPVLKGGNYMSADVRLDKRTADHDPGKVEEHIGFRTVAKTNPKK